MDNPPEEYRPPLVESRPRAIAKRYFNEFVMWWKNVYIIKVPESYVDGLFDTNEQWSYNNMNFEKITPHFLLNFAYFLVYQSTRGSPPRSLTGYTAKMTFILLMRVLAEDTTGLDGLYLDLTKFHRLRRAACGWTRTQYFKNELLRPELHGLYPYPDVANDAAAKEESDNKESET